MKKLFRHQIGPLFHFETQNHCLLALMFSLGVPLGFNRCHSLSLLVIRCHSLSFVVIHCHSLYDSFSIVVIHCITRCHSLSLDVPLVVILCHSMYHLSFYKQPLPVITRRKKHLSKQVLLITYTLEKMPYAVASFQTK